MGYELYREVLDHAPDDLTPVERIGLLVLADDAKDTTRLTFHGPNDPAILRRVRLSESRWASVRSGLVKKGVLVLVSGGNRGGTAKYRIPVFTRAGMVAGNRQPIDGWDDERLPESDGKVAGFGGERLPETGNPTPPVPSIPSSSHPQLPKPRPASPTVTAEEEGSSASPEQQRAQLFLMRLPAPWTLGPADATRIAPQLAAAVAGLGLAYDDHLVAQIATNDFGISNFASVIETKRIPNLRPRAVAAALQPACQPCLNENPAAGTNKRWRLTPTGHPCPTCHPDAQRTAA